MSIFIKVTEIKNTLNTNILKGDLAKSIRSRSNITFGLYKSLMEWFNPLQAYDISQNHTTSLFVDVNINYIIIVIVIKKFT